MMNAPPGYQKQEGKPEGKPEWYNRHAKQQSKNEEACASMLKIRCNARVHMYASQKRPAVKLSTGEGEKESRKRYAKVIQPPFLTLLTKCNGEQSSEKEKREVTVETKSNAHHMHTSWEIFTE